MSVFGTRRPGRGLVALLAASAAGVLGSCMESPTELETTGSIAPRVALVQADAATRASLVLPLTAVRAQVIGPVSRVVDLELKGGAWEGRATGLQPGTYEVIIEGIANGEVQYYGRIASVSVERGAAAEPFITFAPSVPTVAAPPLATTTSFAQRVSFARVAAASGYTIQASKSEAFDAGVIQTTATDTTPVVSVTSEGAWFVRTRASLPQTGSPVPWSAPRSWTVETATGGDTPAAAIAVPSTVTEPQTVSGRNLTSTKRADWFSVSGVRAGDSLIVETFASRLELVSPLNTIVTVFRADGVTEVGSNGDATGTTDSRVAVVAAESETHLVRVTADANSNGHFEVRVAQRRLPAPPTGLAATLVSPTRATLTWTDASDNENSFQVERCTGADCATFAEVGSVAAGVTTFTDSTLTAGESYRWRVRARNDIGNSAYTAIVGLSTAVPNTPTNLSASAVSATVARLTWTDNATDETSTRIERCAGATCEDFAELRTINAANVTTFDDSTIAAGAAYRYRVRVASAVGASAYSNIAALSTLLPAPPTGLTATLLSATRATITWTDASDNETGFTLERCSGAACTGFTAIGTLAAGATSFTDSTLTAGLLYRWRIRAFNTVGNSAYSDVASASTTLPTAPTGLNAAAVSGTLARLTWQDNATDETTTLIERCTVTTSCTFAQIREVTGAGRVTYDDSTVSVNAEYRYRVRVANPVGLSEYSNEASLSTVLPSAPTGLTAAPASGTSVTLTWTDASNNETGFGVERCTGDTCTTFSAVATVAAGVTTYTDTALTTGSTYRYRVRAVNGIGESPYTAIATAALVLPAAPSGLAAVIQAATVARLTWTDNATTETSVQVERCTGATCDTFTALRTISAADVVTFDDSTIAAGNVYKYRVRAASIVGPSAYSNVVTLNATVPAAPTGLGVTLVSATRATLAWTDASDNESGFQVERCSGGAACTTFASVATLAAGAVSFTDSTLTNGETYRWRVRANGAIGNSAFSNIITAVMAAPTAPTGLTAAPVSASIARLNWVNSATTDTAAFIERCTAAPTCTFAPLRTVSGAGRTSFDDSTVAAGNQYQYRVRLGNAVGNSAYSNTATLSTVLPTVPSNLTATAVSATSVDLNWADSSTNETGFEVERCAGASCTTFTLVRTVGANVTTMRDTALTTGTTYSWRVRSVNGIGPSATYSNTATLALAVPAAPTGLNGVMAGDTVSLTWTNPSTNQTSAKVERCTGAGCTNFTQIASIDSANAAAYKDATVAGETTYIYRVRLANLVGNSAYSDTFRITTPIATPTGLRHVTQSATQINLFWTAASSTHTGFEVQRCADLTCATVQATTSAAANDTSLSVGSLTANQTYRFRIRAVRTGSDPSAWSQPVTATTIQPATPANFTAADPIGTTVSLSWDAVSGATGYRISRCSGGGNTCGQAGATYTDIVTVGAGVTSYVATGLVMGTRYRFRIVALNGNLVSTTPAETGNVTP